ncbi:ABC transporter permease subunit [Paenibacillus sp. GD4]|uniref:ABC transporter permease n=1 Tax=Paenibacillus sp. GD4 TaxID=3068890 RepID=UPI002796877A|nr:ABC transporter permease subunit [Paenibacillus sp. GD4]MDQ1914243.1 ABC transporter permease subunit [Paenibacillus sp. GD4]
MHAAATDTPSANPQRSGAERSWLFRTWKDILQRKVLLLMVLPGLIYFFIFDYVPMYGILIAFKDFKMTAGMSFLESIYQSKWVGLEHFQSFFENSSFMRLLRNTLLLSFLSLVFGFPVPILFALALNEVRWALYKRFVQTISYLPHFLSLVAVVGMMKLLLSPSGGAVNTLLQDWFGIEPTYYFGAVEWFRTLYIGSGIWQEMGFGAIIYLAAISKVDTQLYESAVIDGASRLRQMWHITLPALKTTIVVLLILNISRLVGVGADKIILMYSPATYETADVFSTYVYRRGLVDLDFSFGAAVGLFNSVVNVILLVTANYLSKRFTEESLY